MSDQSISELFTQQAKSSYTEIPGKLEYTFGKATISTTVPVSKLLLFYDVDLEVQRAINPHNLSNLMDYIELYLKDEHPIYFPGIILSARGIGDYDWEAEIYRLRPMDKLFVLDGQHRLAAFQRLLETYQSDLARAKEQGDAEGVDYLTEKLRKLYAFPLSIMIYLNIDFNQERQLFSDINKLPRKIGGNLAVLREQRRLYHVLATNLVENDPSFERLQIDTFSERGKGESFQFSYQFLIELLTAYFEGRQKSQARNNRYRFTEQELKQYQERAAFYFSQLLQTLPSPSDDQISWSEPVQIALALFLHGESVKSGKYNQYSVQHAMKLLPRVPWHELQFNEREQGWTQKEKVTHTIDFLKRFYDENGWIEVHKEVN